MLIEKHYNVCISEQVSFLHGDRNTNKNNAKGCRFYGNRGLHKLDRNTKTYNTPLPYGKWWVFNHPIPECRSDPFFLLPTCVSIFFFIRWKLFFCFFFGYIHCCCLWNTQSLRTWNSHIFSVRIVYHILRSAFTWKFIHNTRCKATMTTTKCWDDDAVWIREVLMLISLMYR